MLLPQTDEALAAVIAEAIATGDQLGFLLITTAALHLGRRVSAEHLVGGAALAGSPDMLGNFAWKMDGDVPGALMAAQASTVLAPEIHAATLFIVAAWCAERRDGKFPPEFAGEARRLARLPNINVGTLRYLAAAASKAKDDGFLAVLRQKFPVIAREELEPHTEKVAEATIAIYAAPALAMVPEKAPNTLAHGRPMRRAVEKLGRNERCHCGSGKKYKHCCFETDQERLHFSTEVAGKTHAELRAEPETGLTESRITALPRFELERLDPRKIPANLRRAYITQLTGLLLLDRAAEYFEVVDWDAERKEEWDFAIFFVMRQQRKDIAERMVAAHTRHEPIEDLRDGIRLLLVRDDSVAELSVLAETARDILRETDPETLLKLAYGILCSRHTELGILVCRRLIPILPNKEATFLLNQILEARDRLNLPPDDPFSDVLERRLADETPDEGHDAAELRAARK
ncbi:MAG: SEC-C domain-containing protein, partial [Chthoniobacteraceae bacterium]